MSDNSPGCNRADCGRAEENPAGWPLNIAADDVNKVAEDVCDSGNQILSGIDIGVTATANKRCNHDDS